MVPRMFLAYLIPFLALLGTPFVHGENIDKLQDVLNQLVGHYYHGGGEGSILAGPLQEDIIIPPNVLRDEEHLPYNPLWGHQYMTGGAGEGQQFLSPQGTIPNVKQVKTDSILPAYCDPPNPCPEGFGPDDGCLENVPNTAEFSRDYQSQQNCPCDPEHMFDCSIASGNSINSVSIDGAHQTVRGKKYHEKKSSGAFVDSFNERHPRSVSNQREKRDTKHNPYLQGQPLPVIAKKSPHHKDPKV